MASNSGCIVQVSFGAITEIFTGTSDRYKEILAVITVGNGSEGGGIYIVI
ncbi:secreted glycosyl hydrolase [Corchorus olitorius]|uniref:Secreted glycosyl hydrolase n=1 Tax=Corchorus olitorius TaxID=93759 RepID=A0A1R3G1A5_9ROSI|nr:secreted glycosyl hydrolase [Corchorus olitorius]